MTYIAMGYNMETHSRCGIFHARPPCCFSFAWPGSPIRNSVCWRVRPPQQGYGKRCGSSSRTTPGSVELVLIPLIEAGIERGEIHPVDALEGLKVREEAPAAAPASIMRCALSAPGIYSLRTIFGHLLLVKIVLVAGMIGLSPAHDFFLGRASATWANGYIKPRLPALEPASAKQALQRLRCWTVLIAQLTFVLGGLVILLAASLQSF